MDLLVPAAVVVVVFVSCVFQASVGFGANLIAQPIVFLFAPDLVPGSVLLAIAFMNVLVLLREGQELQGGPLGWAAVGLVCGTAVGGVTISLLSEDGLAILVGLSVLAMVVLMARGVDLPRSPQNVAGAGALGGFAGTTAGIGGPPIAMLFSDADGPTIRGFLASYFLLSSAMTLTALTLAGRFGWTELGNGLLLVPAAVLGFAASKPLLPIVDRRGARPLILITSAVAAVVLLARTVLT